MKTVFSSNDGVVKAWIEQEERYGRNRSGSLYFEWDTIYSYGSHFPIARFVDHETIFLTTKSYSITTSNHVYIVRRCIQQLMPNAVVYDVPAPSSSNYKAILSVYRDRIEQKELQVKRARSNKAYRERELSELMTQTKSFVKQFSGEINLCDWAETYSYLRGKHGA